MTVGRVVRAASWSYRTVVKSLGRELLFATVLALTGLGLAPGTGAAHPGVGLLIGPDGTIYFVLYGPHPVMMLRPGGEPEFVTPDAQPRFTHHLSWAPDGRLLTATDQGDLYAISIGGDAERYFSPEALERLMDAPGAPRALLREMRSSSSFPVGMGGDPFTVDQRGRVYAVHDWDPTVGQRRGIIFRLSVAGEFEPLAGGARPQRDGKGEEAGFGALHNGAMAWGADGALYVTERERIRRVTKQGLVSTFGPELEIGAGLAFDVDGDLLVVEAGPDRLIRVSPSGESRTVINDRRLARLVGVATDSDGGIYLKDHPGDATRIWKLSRDGRLEELATVDHKEIEAAIGYERPPPSDRQLRERRRSLFIMGIGIPLVLLLWWVVRRRAWARTRDA